MMKYFLIAALLIASLYAADFTAEYEHLGYGTLDIKNNNQGGNTMADIVTAYIIFGGIMWLTAAYIYLQRKAITLAYPFYIFGIILFFTATIASAESAASIENYGTMNMMFMLMIGLEWLLLISIGGAFLYIILMIIDKLAKYANIRLEKRKLEGKL